MTRPSGAPPDSRSSEAAADATPAEPDAGRDEHKRIQRLYGETYRDSRFRRRWSGVGPRLNHEDKWETIRAVLASLGLPRPGAKVLDLGAGSGIDCLELDRLGWDRAGVVAVDLLMRHERGRLPWVAWAVADAARLPIVDGSMDLVFQSTMISTVLDERIRAGIYAETARVLKRGGAFVSYDMRYPNPWNRDHRPVRAADLRRAFPGWDIRLTSLTLLPPLARRLAPVSLDLFRLAERFPPLRSHLVASAVKP